LFAGEKTADRGNGVFMPRLLLVDDDEQFLTALTVMLEEEGKFEVVAWARNGAEAVGMSAALSPDLVLMDVDMPVLDGLDATRLIRERQPGTLVLLVSGSAFSERASEFLDAIDAGAVAYLPKAQVPQQLTEAVERALRLGHPVSRRPPPRRQASPRARARVSPARTPRSR
jgi:CheY-like chemotaxis protein